MNVLPHTIRRRPKRHPNLQKILDNIEWLFFDRILRLGVGLAVGVWLARFLGPEQFGQLSYATALVSMFSAVASLGLSGIVVRDLVMDPDSADTTLGSALFLQLLGGLVAVALVVGVVAGLRPDDTLTRTMVAILGFSLVFKASEVVKYWFESQVQSKYSVWVENCVFLLIAAVKGLMILRHAPLMAFVWVVLAESILTALGLLAIYLRRAQWVMRWSLQTRRALTLLKESWPLALSGMTVMLYMRIDQIMLGEIIGAKSIGIYSAAVRITESMYFLPMIIVASAFPSLMQPENRPDFEGGFQRLFDIMLAISLPLAVVLSFFSQEIINLLYGAQYSDAGAVLQIHVWAGVFAFMGVPSGRWYVYENLQKLALCRTAMGAALNVALNFALIPILDTRGAAMATLVSYAMSNILFNAILPRTRYVFVKQMRAFRFHSFFKRDER